MRKRKRSLLRLMLWGSYKRPVVKVLVIFLMFLSSILVGVIAALQFPSVQTYTAKQAAEYFSEKLGLPLEIGYVSINWFGDISLKEIVIRDTRGEVMIAASKAKADFNLNTIFGNKKFTLDQAWVENADVRIIRNAPNDEFNINVFVDRIKNLTGESKPDSLKTTIAIDEIELNNSTFTLSDPSKDSIENKFNYNQFKLLDLNITAENLKSRGKNFGIQILNLSGMDSATQLMIENLSGFYQITDQSMVFRTFNMDVGRSHLEASMVFQFDSISVMKDFVDEVNIIMDIKESDIHTRDLGQFATTFQKYDQRFQLNGFFSGYINRLDVNNFKLNFGEFSHINGSVNLDGLPDIQNTFIDLQITNSILNPLDLSPYLGENVVNNISKFGTSSFNGRFIGFPVDFVSDAVFYTQIGTIDSDINLKINQEDNLPKYSGNLQVMGFDLGKFLDQENLYQNMDLSGTINGEGLYKNDANFYLDASISNFGFLGYSYQNIVMDGRLSSQVFNGYLSIMDPNLIFELNGTIDLTEDREKIDVVAVLDTALLQNLNITKKPASISTQIVVELEDLDVNQATGQISARSTYVTYEDRASRIENLKLIKAKENGYHYLELSSNNLDMHFSGNYEVTSVIKDMNRVIREYVLIAKNDQDSINSYWQDRSFNNLPEYDLDFNISLVNINSFVQLFVPDLYIAENTVISGYLSGGKNSSIILESDIDTLKYKNLTYLDNEIHLNAQKKADTTLIDANLELRSGTLISKKGNVSKNIYAAADWDNDLVKLTLNIDQPDYDNRINILSRVNFADENTIIHFDPSELIILGEKWVFSPENRILINPENYYFDHFRIAGQDQSIELSGYITSDTTKTFTADINNFKVQNLNPVLPRSFLGTLNGFINIQRYYENPVINSNLTVDSLVFESFSVGDILAESQWVTNEKKMVIGIEVLNESQKKLIDVSGNYFPYKETDRLDLIADFSGANLNVIEPFYENLISDLEGNAEGQFEITGSLNKPVLNGTGYVSNGRITLDYIKTNYRFEGNIVFTEDEIGVRNIQISDKFNNTGSLNGGIFHDNFKNVRFDILGTFENLLALNTSINDNDLYYGTAFGTGSIRITGQEKNINMSINAVTDAGTRFFIPLSGSEEVDQGDFVEFVDFSEQARADINVEDEVLKLQGVKLDFDLEITPDAYAEIIFNQKAGDIIRGRGNGKLSMSIDTKGEFNMFGDFVFESGGYNFTLYNVINKEFSIQPSSRITWDGDPYQAQLDLVATYEQFASLAPLFGQQSETFNDNPEVRRKYPAVVELQLEGPLMSPDIDFDIEITQNLSNITVDGINFETQLAAFRSEIQADEQELKRQVFSLIILRRFAEQGSFSVGTSFGNSVSEFISNQLSYWISQLDENLEIDFDLGTLDERAANTFQYRLSYTFNEGRLRITRAGNITEDNPDDISNIIGDWTLEYLLTEDGEIRAKMYNRFNYNSLYSNTQRNSTATAGFSLMHTKSFNNLSELFKGDKKRKKRDSEDFIEFDEGLIPSEPEEETETETLPGPNTGTD